MKRLCLGVLLPVIAALAAGCDDDRRNGYMLDPDSGAEWGFIDNPLRDDGFDWWWHSFVGVDRATGELQPFFIEYFVINPALGGDEPILGQDPANQAAGRRPSYAMIKAGTWAENGSVEIHNFYPISQLSAEVEYMDVQIGDNYATDYELVGGVAVSDEEAATRPELMSDAGTMSWDLTIDKQLSYSVGYAASELFLSLDAFQMYWHVPGMRSELEGTVTLNGQVFDVVPELSAGYQDKNWGNDYTNPWIWLNCNRLRSEKTGELLSLTSLDVGGGDPRAFNISLGRKALIAFYYEGELFEWNFTKELLHQRFDVTETDDELRWVVEAADFTHRIEIDFSAPKSRAQLFDYENPRGERNHVELWNTGWASGTVTLYRRTLFGWKKIDRLHGELGGAEWGSY